MYTNMELWSEVRRRVLTGELTKRAARQEYHLHWDTLQKILENEEPPGYRQRKEREKPVLGPFIPLIHEILEADKKAPKKQRHTAKRIFERLREKGYTGGITVVQEEVRRMEAAVGRGLHAAGASTGRSPGRFRRGDGRLSRAGAEDRVLRDDVAL